VGVGMRILRQGAVEVSHHRLLDLRCARRYRVRDPARVVQLAGEVLAAGLVVVVVGDLD
jgi:hypothetical protein